jgi:methionine-rich copper-binding protein CopC
MTTQRANGLPVRWLVPLFAALTIVALPMSVSAHAELDTAAPVDGSTVAGPFAGPIVLTFTEALASGSGAELIDSAGAVPVTTTVDGSTMTVTPSTVLPAGGYEVRWTSIADDGHVERGTVRFTVEIAATPEPTTSSTPAASSTAAPSASPPPSPAVTAASAAPSAGSGTSGDASSGGGVILPIVAGTLLVGALAILLIRRRDSTSTPP